VADISYMPILPTSIAQSLAGLDGAQRARAVEARKKPAPRTDRARAPDELIVGTDAIERAGALRPLAGNAEEDSHEDRQSGEGRDTRTQQAPNPPRLDVAG
jgi:hypothetical protein